MFIKHLVSVALTIGLGLTSPLAPTPTLKKRAAGTPSIGLGFTAQQTEQLMDAFKDANELADFAINSVNKDVFDLYFPSSDFDTVQAAFKKIYKNNGPTATLSAISVVTDYPNPDTGDLACTEDGLIAQLRDYDEDDPKMIICPNRAFPHGGIDKGYPDVEAITCDYIEDIVSWKMDTLGATILHEYFHWTELVTAPPDDEAIIDEPMGNGPYNCQKKLPKKNAIYNADSYTWYATQNFWTSTCKKTYGPPTADSAKDPYCNDQVCIENRG